MRETPERPKVRQPIPDEDWGNFGNYMSFAVIIVFVLVLIFLYLAYIEKNG